MVEKQRTFRKKLSVCSALFLKKEEKAKLALMIVRNSPLCVPLGLQQREEFVP